MKENYNEEEKMERVVFTFSEDEILRELLADSSYIAKCMVRQVELQPGWSDNIIFTEDNRLFFDRWFADVRDELTRSLLGYLSGEITSTDSAIVLGLILSQERPIVIDETICHQLERAIVHYILAQWYTTTYPDESQRQRAQYHAALSSVKTDIRLARNRRPRRPTNYF